MFSRPWGEVIVGSLGPALPESSGTHEGCAFLGLALNFRRASGRSSPLGEEVALCEWTLPIACPSVLDHGLWGFGNTPAGSAVPFLPSSSFPFSSPPSSFCQSRVFYFQEPVRLASLLSTRGPDVGFRPRALWSRGDVVAPSWAPVSLPAPSHPQVPITVDAFPPMGGGLVSAQQGA